MQKLEDSIQIQINNFISNKLESVYSNSNKN